MDASLLFLVLNRDGAEMDATVHDLTFDCARPPLYSVVKGESPYDATLA